MNTVQTYFYHAGQMRGDEQVILFHNGDVLLRNEAFLWPSSVLEELHEAWYPLLLVGEFAQRRVVALNLPADWVQEDFEVARASPRQLLLERNLDDFSAIGRANQLINWFDHHRFCGKCGAPTISHNNARALVCTACAAHFYPRINPCVIVLVTKGDEFLLALHKKGRGAYYSCLAGFMEVGETPEETVQREVKEEVGLNVGNIRYIKSQSWPFPSQLMLGFFVDYQGGDIEVDGIEIEHAQWYSAQNLPQVPPAGVSVAGQLIELFLQRKQQT